MVGGKGFMKINVEGEKKTGGALFIFFFSFENLHQVLWGTDALKESNRVGTELNVLILETKADAL